LNSSVILAGARGLYYCALLSLFGELAFGLLLRAKLPVILAPNDKAIRWSALTLALAGGTAWLLAAAGQMAGALSWDALAATITATLFGQLFVARTIALLGLALAFFSRHGAKPALLLAAIALALPAATSHAAASSPAGFAVLGTLLDAVHLLTAGFWIGGLVVLAMLFRRGEPNMLLALSLFSEWAMIAVLLLVMTGLINGASILLGDKGAPSLSYLAVLGAKLALVAVMLSLAILNRLRLMPAGEHRRIARNAAWELGLGLIVVLLAGVLGQLQPTLQG
jgi:putative copper resistance protein D